MKFEKQAFLVALIGILLFGCKKKEEENTLANYNRSALLTHYYDRLIMPAFQSLDGAAKALENTSIRFANEPTQANLLQARESLDSAFKVLQYVHAFDFGPSELPTGSLTQEIGTFPVDTNQMEVYMAEADTNFNNFRRDTRGINAIDYLLWGKKQRQSDIMLSVDTNAKKRAYIRAVARHFSAQVAIAKNNWLNYKATFIGSTGTEAGSSIANLFNTYNIGFETLKNFKLGLPLGRRAGQSQAEPHKVEAYFSGKSTGYALRHFQHILQVWEGMGANGIDGPGFREYLLAAKEQGARLVADTEIQVNKAIEAGNNLPLNEPLAGLIATNDQRAFDFFNELMATTRFFKSEMASITGIAISYNSGDGD